MTQAEMVAYIARQVQRLGSLRAAARQWGVSKQYIADVLHGRRGPGPKLVQALGYEVVVTTVYRKRKRGRAQQRALAPDAPAMPRDSQGGV